MEDRKKRNHYRLELKMRVGTQLNQEKRRGYIKEVAKLLNVSVRTLRNWKTLAKTTERKRIGRPRHTKRIHQTAMWAVARELKKQSYIGGWRGIARSLGGRVPTRLIQKYVAIFKARRNKRIEKRRIQMRVSTEVLFKNIVWGQDSTELQNKIKVEVIKDRGTLKLLSAHAEKKSTTVEAMSALKKASEEQKMLPLVLMTDNGSEYVSEKMKAFLKENKIIHLRSLPRTPQHNGATENAVREIKEASEKQIRGSDESLSSIQLTLMKAKEKINRFKLRGSKDYKTSKELDDTLMKYPSVDRDEFYKECCSRISRYVNEANTTREVRLAEREAIHAVLEEYGFIKRTRGGQSYAGRKRENIF